jgi:(heptosyl)LPS beta-1,4-glucosyltransferase
MPGITVVIITRNEARNLPRCLASVAGVADEIIVADSGSTDGTQRIAQAAGVRLLEVQWQGYAATKNAANALARHPYILSLDADEALTPELRQAILAAKPALLGTYSFARLTNYCGHWVRYGGWYPDEKLRLFPATQARWVGDFVHETLVPDPQLPHTRLPGDLLHYSVYSPEEHAARAMRYSLLAAQDVAHGQRKGLWIKALLSPPALFLKMFVFRGGWRDGFTGFWLALVSAHAQGWRYWAAWAMRRGWQPLRSVVEISTPDDKHKHLG